MDLERLRRLGFDLSTGFVYRDHKVWGAFTAAGALLSPDGEDLVARLEEGDDPSAPSTREPRTRGLRTRNPKPKEPTQFELPGLGDIGSLLDT